MSHITSETLSPVIMSTARTINLTPGGTAPVDHSGSYLYLHGFEPLVLVPPSTFKFNGLAGATYNLTAYSYFSPSMALYDSDGHVLAVSSDSITTPEMDLINGFVAPHTGTYYVTPGFHRGTMFSQLSVSMAVMEDRDTAARTKVGASGEDSFTDSQYSDVIDGGGGKDTMVYGAARNQYQVERTADGAVWVNAAGANSDKLMNVERLQFADGTMAFDTDGTAGQAYRLYQAAFARTPDASGLGFHIRNLDAGHSLNEIASGFISSAEFAKTYGSVNNSQFVTQLYQNVLHRAPDAEGLAYHVGRLDTGSSRAEVLVGFSESPENQAALIGTISNGMAYTI